MKSFLSFRLDEVNQCLWKGQRRIALMPKPFAVLSYLVNHAGRLVTHDELLNAIWPDTYVQPEVLRRYVLEIRRVLGDSADHPRFVETVTKRGYRFVARVDDVISDLRYQDIANAASIVGRQSALSTLEFHLSKAVRGQRQLVFVSGEPGIGKTSLVDAFQNAIVNVEGLIVARGQSVEGFGGKEAY